MWSRMTLRSVDLTQIRMVAEEAQCQWRLSDFWLGNWLDADAYHQYGNKRRDADFVGNKGNLILNMLVLRKLQNIQFETTGMLYMYGSCICLTMPDWLLWKKDDAWEFYYSIKSERFLPGSYEWSQLHNSWKPPVRRLPLPVAVSMFYSYIEKLRVWEIIKFFLALLKLEIGNLDSLSVDSLFVSPYLWKSLVTEICSQIAFVFL